MAKGYDEFTSMPAVRAAFDSAGSKWFSRGAMKWFNSKVESSLIGGRYFITSERYSLEDSKLFNVRMVVRNEDGTLDIETVGEHMTYATKQEAMNALEEYRNANN